MPRHLTAAFSSSFVAFAFGAALFLGGCTASSADATGPLIDGIETPARVARNADGAYSVSPRVKFHDPNGDDVAIARVHWNAIDAGVSGVETISLPSTARSASGGALLDLTLEASLSGVVEMRIVLVDETGLEGEAIVRRILLEH